VSHWFICTPSFGFQLHFTSSGANHDKRQAANWHRNCHPVWHTNFHPNCHHNWDPILVFSKCNANW
jgi:hypothetical protein